MRGGGPPQRVRVRRERRAARVGPCSLPAHGAPRREAPPIPHLSVYAAIPAALPAVLELVGGIAARYATRTALHAAARPGRRARLVHRDKCAGAQGAWRTRGTPCRSSGAGLPGAPVWRGRGAGPVRPPERGRSPGRRHAAACIPRRSYGRQLPRSGALPSQHVR